MIPTHKRIKDRILSFSSFLIIVFFVLLHISCKKGKTSFDNNEILYVNKDNAILRTNPTTYSFEVALLPQGEELIVIKNLNKSLSEKKEKNNWYYVETSKGYKGWISENFLSKKKPQKQELKSSISREGVSLEIIGDWWEIDFSNLTGNRNIKFEEFEGKKITQTFEGKFTYQFRKENTVNGKFKILEDGRIELEPVIPIGKYIYIIKNVEGFRLLAKIEDVEMKEILFKKIIKEEEEEEQEEKEETKDEKTEDKNM